MQNGETVEMGGRRGIENGEGALRPKEEEGNNFLGMWSGKKENEGVRDGWSSKRRRWKGRRREEEKEPGCHPGRLMAWREGGRGGNQAASRGHLY